MFSNLFNKKHVDSTCPDCNGFGHKKVGASYEVCPTCNGSGKRATKTASPHSQKKEVQTVINEKKEREKKDFAVRIPVGAPLVLTLVLGSTVALGYGASFLLSKIDIPQSITIGNNSDAEWDSTLDGWSPITDRQDEVAQGSDALVFHKGALSPSRYKKRLEGRYTFTGASLPENEAFVYASDCRGSKHCPPTENVVGFEFRMLNAASLQSVPIRGLKIAISNGETGSGSVWNPKEITQGKYRKHRGETVFNIVSALAGSNLLPKLDAHTLAHAAKQSFVELTDSRKFREEVKSFEKFGTTPTPRIGKKIFSDSRQEVFMIYENNGSTGKLSLFIKSK